jgi:hypothetical protein
MWEWKNDTIAFKYLISRRFGRMQKWKKVKANLGLDCILFLLKSKESIYKGVYAVCHVIFVLQNLLTKSMWIHLKLINSLLGYSLIKK